MVQPSTENPIARFVRHQGVMVLDGGLATTLESRGRDLNDDLWSAKVLLESHDDVRRVHLDFLEAGADCIATVSYQASLPGFAKRGLSKERGIDLLRKSVQLAVDARDAFWSESANRQGRLQPVVAASVGPYGAFLADGSEYTGRYEIDNADLYSFHEERWHVLAESQADLLGCETIPSRDEAVVLLRLLRETPGRWAWLSFSCRDGTHLCDGVPIGDVARLCDREPQIAAVGINCTAPEVISALIAEVRRVTEKPVIVYPNSGEQYDSGNKTWIGVPAQASPVDQCVEWTRMGAAGIGGCCRVGPADIAAMRRRLVT